jgi:hypothetical protein
MKRLLWIIPLLCSLAWGQGGKIGGSGIIGGSGVIGASTTAAGFTLVQKCYGYTTVASTSIATGAGSGATACSAFGVGHTIITFGCSGFGDNPSAFGDGGDTFTVISDGGFYCSVGYIMSSAGGGTTVTATIPSNTGTITVLEYSGLTAEDQNSTAHPNSTTISVGPTSTLAASTELGFAASFSSAGIVSPSATGQFSSATTPYNLSLNSASDNIALQTITLSSNAAVTYSATASNTVTTSMLVTFR